MISSMVLFFRRDNCGAGPAVEAPKGGTEGAGILPVPLLDVAVLLDAIAEDACPAALAAGLMPNKLEDVAGAVVLGVDVVADVADVVGVVVEVLLPTPLNRLGTVAGPEVVGAIVLLFDKPPNKLDG